MLKCGQEIIDLNKLSINAIKITNKLIEISKDFQNHCLVLLDPFLNPIDETFMMYFQNRLRLYQVPIMHSSVPAVKRPWLIQLDLRDKYEQAVLIYMLDRALKQLKPEFIAIGKGQQYCAWLFTNANPKSIADGLGQLALQKQGNTVLLRYYDPAVFFQLMSLLNPTQQNLLLGEIKIWGMLSREGVLKIRNHESKVYPVYGGKLNLTHEQYQQIECIVVNNKIIQSMRLEEAIINIDEIKMLKQISPCLIRLKKKNIEDQDLQLEWAKLALRLGQNFDLIESIAKKIETFLHYREYLPLVKQLQTISQHDWQTLA